jgi:ubiquitin carboxyl-terminal hydrolase 36/42
VLALRNFTRAEVLDGDNKYRCDKCANHVRATKGIKIVENPLVLVIHLKVG